ncbi:transmembrane E3 ubiquitin-protein ligase FLY2-like isoform X2 [Wolffia australiana]
MVMGRTRRWISGFCSLIFILCQFVDYAAALRPIREKLTSSSSSSSTIFTSGSSFLIDEPILRRSDDNFGPYSARNITGTYKGEWKLFDSDSGSSRYFRFGKTRGISIFELVSTPGKIRGVHYVQGSVSLHDIIEEKKELAPVRMRVEGVYIWPYRQLRLVVTSETDAESGQEEYFSSNPYHLVLSESSNDKSQWRKSLVREMEKHCRVEIAAQLSLASPTSRNGVRDRYRLEGIMESPSINEDGDCFSTISLNATSVNIELYYNKAVNYTLMVTFISFLQVLLLIRQMEHSSTQSGAAKVSIVMIGQQAIMDAYLCLLHLTAGILVESLFNAFATAAFFKFVVFSIFEMRYLLAIWKANRPLNAGESWESLRQELSSLYSRFYGVLLGGILIMYEFRSILRYVLLLMYSFWIPQIVSNVLRDTRKPLHPHYIIGMTITRLAVPLYLFGCPENFMRIEVDKTWCICLGAFVGVQAAVLLLQHYLGSRCFIPRKILPEKYSYYRKLDNCSSQSADCVICMASIDTTQQPIDHMLTPCEHLFHTGCLQRWMDVKMECPTCRRPLPPA